MEFKDKYRQFTQKIGIGHSIFTLSNYYNDNRLIDPYGYERIFGTEIEPLYVNIMNEVNSEKNLSFEIRKNLLVWLLFSQIKKPIWRENSVRISKWYVDTVNQFKGVKLSDYEKNVLKTILENKARQRQLDFLSSESTKDLMGALAAKKWRIIRRHSSSPFWTNDNPGFSPNLSSLQHHISPFHTSFEN